MGSFFDALYTRLLLRDVLGKMVPGSILLVSLYLTFVSDQSDLGSAFSFVTTAPWTFWVAMGLLGWLTAFAIQAMGGWLPKKRYLPYIRYSAEPIADALEFHRKLVTFARVASDSEKQVFERFMVVKEAAGNASLSALLSIAFLLVRFHQPNDSLVLGATAIGAVFLGKMHRDCLKLNTVVLDAALSQRDAKRVRVHTSSVADDTVKLLAAFQVVIEANKGIPSDADDRVLDAEGLALKCFIHAASCLYLHRSTTVPELQASFFDLASMNVLARATIESFLVFHYVFAAPQNEDEREFRHLSWVLADLLERQEAPATLPENQAKQKEEMKEIELLRKRLEQNSVFQSLTTKQQTAVLEKQQWRLQPWTKIAQHAGLSQLHAAFAYRYLCSYAHSGSLSVLQVRQAKTREDQVFLSEMGLRLVNVAVAFMTRSYATMFPRSQDALASNDALRHTVNEWTRLGAEG